ncbi:MAG: hypothetical protein IPL11_00295 [Candidatus Accumulibacter sp.]|nr:hypothetical protein [Accumulibacter sp.]
MPVAPPTTTIFLFFSAMLEPDFVWDAWCHGWPGISMNVTAIAKTKLPRLSADRGDVGYLATIAWRKTQRPTGCLTTTWGARKHTPFGVVNEDSGSSICPFGSSAKTSDFIIDSLYAWWSATPESVAPRSRRSSH